MLKTATARAHPNIAFIKYWGNQNDDLRIPVNPSLSMNLAEFFTETMVTWDETLTSDKVLINQENVSGQSFQRVQEHLTYIRRYIGIDTFTKVKSTNNFPTGAGIASSASAFAALTVAAFGALQITVSEKELSTIARLGSGSASRSVPNAFVEWFGGNSHEESYAQSFADADHWNLVDIVAIVSKKHKTTVSRVGHTLASTSDLQDARVNGAEKRFQICRQAILERDFNTFARIVELDSNLMHAIMMTSQPPLFYWEPTTLKIMESIRNWRVEGIDVCYTIDAGPNVHCICTGENAQEVRNRLQEVSGVLDVRTSGIGGGAHLVKM